MTSVVHVKLTFILQVYIDKESFDNSVGMTLCKSVMHIHKGTLFKLNYMKILKYAELIDDYFWLSIS